MKRISALVLLIICALSLVATEAGYDYGKVRWGMTFEEVSNALGEKPLFDFGPITREKKYCGFEFDEEYSFTRSRLDKISFEIDKEALPYLVRDFTRKFGNPYTFKTNMNSFPFEAYYWKSNRTEAKVLLFWGYCQVNLKPVKPLTFEKTDSLF